MGEQTPAKATNKKTAKKGNGEKQKQEKQKQEKQKQEKQKQEKQKQEKQKQEKQKQKQKQQGDRSLVGNRLWWQLFARPVLAEPLSSPSLYCLPRRSISVGDVVLFLWAMSAGAYCQLSSPSQG